MELPTYFEDFLKEIRPTVSQRDDYKEGQRRLRERLAEDEELGPVLVSTFLQGSYRRATAVRPSGDKRPDVDIIVVTKLSPDEYTPAEALALFERFAERHYAGKYQPQGRSVGITLSYVSLDLVVTAAPSESELGILRSDSVTANEDLEEVPDWRLHRSWLQPDRRFAENAVLLLSEAVSQPEWKVQPLLIPDREVKVWAPTHPLEQIQWTRDKNARCSRHFVNVVKALKWWRQVNYPESKHPKGFPLERIIGECCPDGIRSVAEGVTRTIEELVERFRIYSHFGIAPSLSDYGVPSHNVLARVSGSDFCTFYKQAEGAAAIARRAFDSEDKDESVEGWREFFGSKFPMPPKSNSARPSGFSPRKSVTIPGSGRFA